MRIAWFTPFARHSAIGRVGSIIVQQLLADGHEVAIYADGINSFRETHTTTAPVVLLQAAQHSRILSELTGYQIVIYNLGNHLNNHRHIYEISQQHPGIVIMHDMVMTHFFNEYFLSFQNDPDGYRHAMTYAHGAEGLDFADRALSGRGGNIWNAHLLLDFNLAKFAMRGAYGIITHSPYSAERLSAVSTAPVRYIPFPTPDMTLPAKIPASDGRVRLLTFGDVNPNKMVHQIIDAVGKSPLLHQRVHYDVIGRITPQYTADLQHQIDNYGLHQQIRLHGYQSDDFLRRALADTDIVLVLRNPHLGESSWSLLESLKLGKPTVVWDHGHYATFPDDVVAKVGDADELRSVLERLTENHEAREALGQAAAVHIAQDFTTENCAAQILTFARETRYNAPVFRVLDDLVEELRILGADQHFPQLQELVAHNLYLISN
jgi:glycosyltransferase involved in cell wall biosynthesis